MVEDQEVGDQVDPVEEAFLLVFAVALHRIPLEDPVDTEEDHHHLVGYCILGVTMEQHTHHYPGEEVQEEAGRLGVGAAVVEVRPVQEEEAFQVLLVALLQLVAVASLVVVELCGLGVVDWVFRDLVEYPVLMEDVTSQVLAVAFLDEVVADPFYSVVAAMVASLDDERDLEDHHAVVQPQVHPVVRIVGVLQQTHLDFERNS